MPRNVWPNPFRYIRRSNRAKMAAQILGLGGSPAVLASAPKFRKRVASKPQSRRPSYAMTTTQRKKQGLVRIKPLGAGVTTNSYFRLRSRPSAKARAMKKVGAPNVYLSNSGLSFQCVEGFQASSQHSWCNIADLNTIRGFVPGSGTLPVPGSVIPNQYILESMIGEVVYTNASTATCELELYDIVRKRDAHATGTATQSPINAWEQGMINAEQTGATSPQNFLKSTPFDSKLFQDWFKVVKRTRIQLTQGATHRHSVNLSPNRLVDEELLAYTGADVAGLTVYTMCRVYGQPASILNDPLPPDVTTAAIRIDAVQSVRYKYTWVADTVHNVFVTDNLTSHAGEQVLSIGKGEFIPNTLG